MALRRQESAYELLQHEQYTPEEVAALLEIGIDVVRHAAFTGELRALIVGHDIISLRREDVLTWLEQHGWVERGGRADASE